MYRQFHTQNGTIEILTAAAQYCRRSLPQVVCATDVILHLAKYQPAVCYVRLYLLESNCITTIQSTYVFFVKKIYMTHNVLFNLLK